MQKTYPRTTPTPWLRFSRVRAPVCPVSFQSTTLSAIIFAPCAFANDQGQAMDAGHESLKAGDVVEADQIAERIYDDRDPRCHSMTQSCEAELNRYEVGHRFGETQWAKSSS
jgi:hypothetical protein